MTAAERFKQMLASQEFNDLSPQEQFDTKQYFAEQAFTNEPELQDLTGADRMYVYKAMMTTPHGLNDAKMQAALSELNAKALAGDAAAQDAIDRIGSISMQSTEGGMFNALAAGATGLPDKIFDPESKDMYLPDGTLNPDRRYQNTFMRYFQNPDQKVSDWYKARTKLTGADETQMNAQGVANFFNNVLDFMTPNAPANLIGSAVRGATKIAKGTELADAAIMEGARFTPGLLTKSARAQEILMGRMLPAAVTGAADAAMKTPVFGATQAAITGNEAVDPLKHPENTLFNTATGAVLGGVLGSISRGTVNAMAPSYGQELAEAVVGAAQAARYTFGKGVSKVIDDPAALPFDEQLAAIKNDAMVNPALRSELSPIQNAQHQFITDTQNAVDQLNAGQPLNAFQQLQLNLRQADLREVSPTAQPTTLTANPDGTFQIWSYQQGVPTPFKVPTVLDAYDVISNGIKPQLDSLGPEIARYPQLSKAAQLADAWNIVPDKSVVASEFSYRTAANIADDVARNPIASRIALSPEEANHLVNSNQAIRVKLDLTPEITARMDKRQGTPWSYEDGTIKQSTDFNAIATVRNPLKVDRITTENVVNARLTGHDAIYTETNGIKEYMPTTNRTVMLVSPNVDALSGKFVAGSYGKPVAPPISPENVAVKLQQNIEAKIPEAALGNDAKLLAEFAGQRFRGDIDASDVALFLRSTGFNTKFRIVRANKTNMLSANEAVNISKGADDTLVITIPKELNSAEATARFTTALIRQTNEFRYLSTTKSGVSDMVLRAMDGGDSNNPVFKVFNTLNRDGTIVGRQWLDDVITKDLGGKLNKTEQGFEAVLPTETLRSPDLIGLFRQLRSQLVSPVAIKNAIRSAGYDMRYNRKLGQYEVNVNGKLYTGDTPNAIASQLSINITSLPSKYRPLFVEAAEDGNVHIYGEQNTLQIPSKDAAAFLSSFDPADPILKTTTLKNDSLLVTLFDQPTSVALVDSTTKSRLEFANMADAVKFVKDGQLNEFGGVQKIAASKGMYITRSPLGYDITTMGDTKVATVDSLAKAKDILAKVDTRNIDANEIIPGFEDLLPDLPVDLVTQWKALGGDLTPKYFRDPILERASVWHGPVKERMGSPMQSRLSNLAKLIETEQLPPDARIVTRNIEAAHRGYNETRFRNDALLETLVKTSNGKPLGFKDRVALLMNLQARTPMEVEAAAKLHPLSDEGKIIADKIRQTFGIQTEYGITGLAGKFNIKASTYLQVYMPQLRRVFNTVGSEVFDSSKNLDDFFGRIQGTADAKMLNEMQAFFKFCRKEEFAEALHDTDAISVLRRYMAVGSKQYWLDTPIKEFNRWYHANVDNIGPKAQTFLGDLIHDISGNTELSAALKAAYNIGENIGKAIQPVSKIIVKSPLNKILKWDADYVNSPQYAESFRHLIDDVVRLEFAGFVGLRPSSAIMNSLQAHTLGAALYGPEFISKAVNTLHTLPKNELKGMLSYLKQAGVLSEIRDYTPQGTPGSTFNKLVDKTLSWFANADDYSRALSYIATMHKFNEAFTKLSKGISDADFLDLLDSSIFRKSDPMLRQQIVDLARIGVNTGSKVNGVHITGEAAKAQHLYARAMTEVATFNYAAYNKPVMFRSNGLFGRVAGMLGSYPAHYRSYFRLTMANMTAAERARFITGFIINNMAFQTAFKAVGIQTQNFIPFLPAIQGVGPNAEMMHQLFSIPGAALYGKDQSREVSKLGREALRAVPLVGTGVNVASKVTNYLNRDEPDYWSAFLSLGTFSADGHLVRPGKRQPVESEELPLDPLSIANGSTERRLLQTAASWLQGRGQAPVPDQRLRPPRRSQ